MPALELCPWFSVTIELVIEPTTDLARYSSPLLRRTGAVELQDDDSLLDARGVAWHYGDPLGEQRPVEDGGVVVDRSHRRVLKVSGEDAAAFLNNLLSQKLDDTPDGFSASALDLDIQGHILHHADVSIVAGTHYLDVPSTQGDSFADFLRKMVFWSKVEVEDTDLGVLTVLGGAQLPDTGAEVTREVDWSGPPRRDLLVDRGELGRVVDTLLVAGIRLAGLMTFTTERVKALEPELAADLDERAIAHEVPGFIGRGTHAGAVHLNKGCYRGQETVARVENLGRSPRLLVLLHLDGSAPQDPVIGDALSANGRTVGRLGTVVHDRDFGPVALGLLKRSALGAEQLSVVPLDRAEVSAVVDRDSLPVDEGEKAGRAAIDRLRSGQ